MIYRALILAAALAVPGILAVPENAQATIVGFGQLGGNNTTVPATLASRATAAGNGFVVSNGATPNIALTWDANWDIHTSTFFQPLENFTVGGDAWDNEGNTQRIGQLDIGTHTLAFAVDAGAQLVLNSFDFGHTAETAGTTMWNLTLTDSAANVAWSQSVTFANGATEKISPNFTGVAGEDYTLTFARTSETYGSNGRHGIDNLSFNQLPDLSNSVGALVINRSGPNAGTAYFRADQGFAFREYEIRSLSGALNPAGWSSITSTNADPGDDWSIVSSTANSLHEQDGAAGANNGLSLNAGGQYNLGHAFGILPTFRRDGTTPTGWEDAGLTINNPSGGLLAVTPEYVGASVPWGDYNGDLAVDLFDWPLFRAGLGKSYADLSAPQAYLRGDLDGDFDSDIHDYNIFVQLAGGAGALFGSGSVPEPSSAALLALGCIVACISRRRRSVALLAAVAAFSIGSRTHAQQSLQNFSVVGSTPITSIPVGQQNENANAGPEKMFDDDVLDDPGQIVFDLFSTNYTDPELFPGGFLGQYAIGGEMPGVADSAVVFMDYGSSVSANWFAYAQRTGGNPVADKVGKFEFWFSNTDFAGALPSSAPDAVVNLLPGDNRINDSVIRPYSLGGDRSGRYVALRITETAASGALTSTSRIGGHEFRLLDGPSDVVLTVNRTNGEMTLRNNLADSENIFLNAYTIDSPGGALKSASFNGVRGDAGFPLGNGSGNGWELAPSNNPNHLVETFFTGQTTLAAGAAPISLGNAYNNLSGIEDLAFLWTNSQGEVYNARVEYVGIAPRIPGDYNDDGRVDAADYTKWRDTLGQNVAAGSGADGDNNGKIEQNDYNLWKTNFGAPAGSGATLRAVQAPEPAAAALALMAAVALVICRRK